MIAITGKSGFLGSHIQGEAIQGDLRNYSTALKEIKRLSPDTILHLAAVVGGIKFNSENPSTLLADNIQIGLNLFKAAKDCGVKRVVTIGSTCAYPSTATPPFKTSEYWDGYPEATNGAYGVSKRVLCELGQAYSKQHGIEHCHIILANLYGPGDDFSENGHAIPSLINKFLTQKVVEVWGDGTAKREFLYVKDAARLVLDITDSPINGLINVGSGECVTIKQLVGLIRTAIGSKSIIKYLKDRPNGQMERMLKSDFVGTTPLATGLKETIAWHKSLNTP